MVKNSNYNKFVQNVMYVVIPVRRDRFVSNKKKKKRINVCRIIIVIIIMNEKKMETWVAK